MGLLTLAEFRDEVRFVCGGISSNSPAWPNSRLDRRINASYLWVSMPNHYRHPELEATETILLATGDATYSLANTYYMIYSVSHIDATFGAETDESRRRKLDPIDMREQGTILRTQRQPNEYSWWNNQIVLAGVPDTASVGQSLEVRGYLQPDTMTADTETTLLRAEWDEVIVVGAEWRVWISLNEADRAYEAKQNFGQLVNEVADTKRLHAEEWGWQTAANDHTIQMRID